MKKIIAILLILVSAFAIVSCGKGVAVENDWRQKAGIDRWMEIKIQGEPTMIGGKFSADGIEFYYNDPEEEKHFCTVEYNVKDADPKETAKGLSIDDVNSDGSGDLLLNILTEDGERISVIYYWTPGAGTFKTVD